MEPNTVTLTLTSNRGRFGLRIEGHPALEAAWAGSVPDALRLLATNIEALAPPTYMSIFGALNTGAAAGGAQHTAG